MITPSRPMSQHKLCEFLGLVNFYRCFIPNEATLLHPFKQLLSRSTSWTLGLDWSDVAVVFDAAMDALALATLLVRPMIRVLTCIMMDSSDEAACRSCSAEWSMAALSIFLKESETNWSQCIWSMWVEEYGTRLLNTWRWISRHVAIN